MYTRVDLITTKITLPSIANDIQYIAFELNLRKQKWLIISIYRSPKTKASHFIEQISKFLDFYSLKYDRIVTMGDFNLEPDDKWLKQLLLDHNLYNLVKERTCYKSLAGSTIDLILTNKKFSFKYTQTFETGVSDHHRMIYTMLKTTFQKLPPKKLKYRSYKNIDESKFQTDLVEEIKSAQPGNFSVLNTCITKVIDCHAPLKTKLIRGTISRTLLKNSARK